MTTARELSDELLRLRGLLDQANAAVRDRGRNLAVKEKDYREARARAWLHTSPGATAEQRKDEVNAATADERYIRDLADSDRQAALEAVRNYRTQISALQTVSGVEREMAAFDRTSPDGGP